MKKVTKEIIELIKKNQIPSAIFKLSEVIEDKKILKELILIEASYDRILSSKHFESFEDLDRYYSRITNSLLDIVDDIDWKKVKKKSNKEILKSHSREIDVLLEENQNLKEQLDHNLGIIKGKRLFQYEGLYPIDLEPKTDIPSLNREKFAQSVEYFLKDGIYDRLAASDIVYLRKDNLDHEEDILDESMRPRYAALVEKYDLEGFIYDFKRENDKVLGNYIRIVNEFGRTIENSHLEILLHNVRNPLRSVVAAQNTENISGRILFDPSTRFVVEYVRHQGKHLIKAFEGRGKVSYEKEFKNGTIVKATTTPIFDSRYGLVGILCINIDIDAVKETLENNPQDFLGNYCNILTDTETDLRNIQ